MVKKAYKVFNSDYNEIVITRKLYRSGESEYLLNKTPSRLKDIVNLLHDSGIGKNGYSIIGQGMVGKIVNSKPEERRVIFEEAAGVLKYKKHKEESLRKLEKTKDNLNTINLLISELETSLEPLRIQSIKAKKFNEYTKILYSQSRLIEGLSIENPTEISNLICDLLSK